MNDMQLVSQNSMQTLMKKPGYACMSFNYMQKYLREKKQKKVVTKLQVLTHAWQVLAGGPPLYKTCIHSMLAMSYTCRSPNTLSSR